MPPLPRLQVPPSVAVIIVQATEITAQIAAGILIARGLGPDAFGHFTHAMALAAVCAALLLFGTGDVAISLYANRPTHPQRVLSASATVLLVGAILCMGGTLAFCLVLGVVPQTLLYLELALVALALNGANSVLNQALVAYERAVTDIGGAILSKGVLVGGVAWAAASDALVGVFVAYVFAAAVQVVLRARTVHRHVFPLRWMHHRATLATLWRRGAKVGIGGIFGMISNRSDILLLRAIRGVGETGLYGAAARVIGGIYAAGAAVSLAALPGYERSLRTGNVRGRRIYFALPAVASITLLIAALTLPDVVHWLNGPAYVSAVPTMRILLFAAALQVPMFFIMKALVITHREASLPTAQGASAVVNISLNLMLMPTLGAEGAAWATLVAEGVLFGWLVGIHNGIRPLSGFKKKHPLPVRPGQ